MRVAFFTRYDDNGASSRVRAMQYTRILQSSGIEPEFLPLLSNEYLTLRYQRRNANRETLSGYARRCSDLLNTARFELLWIEKELFPFAPYVIERAALRGKPFVLDFDDAIFHNYDLSPRATIRRLLGQKIDRLMADARIVIAGNGYLADRAARAGARNVERLPSAIDLSLYPTPGVRQQVMEREPTQPFRIAWIGSPATAHYLEMLKPALQQLALRTRLELHVIGASAPEWPGVAAVSVPWSAETEAQSLSRCDAGVMPLSATPWEKGKCSFKLIQYMACGLPVVASPVGMNLDVVHPGRNGLLAATDQDWISALEQLAAQPDLRISMGEVGRAEVEQRYCIQVTGARLADLLRSASGR